MSRFKLRERLLLLTLLPSALLAMTLVAYFVFSGIREMESELRERGMAVVRYLAPVSEYGIISGNLESLQGLTQTTIQQPDVKSAMVVSRSGRILAVSGKVSLPRDLLRTPGSQPGVVSENEESIAFAAPVLRTLAEADALFEPDGTRPDLDPIGQIFVEFRKTGLLERQHALVVRGLAIIVLGLMLLALLAIAIANSVTRPMTRLVDAVRKMAQGYFDTRVAARSFGEFGELESGFNHMAQRIAEVHQTMQERIESTTAQLAFQARHDALTGLINRREFESRLEQAVQTAQAGGNESSLLFLDLDRLKAVNDTAGHLAGDELLRQLSRLIQNPLRDKDTLARLGGDEFGILLDNCVGSRAVQIAEDICRLTSSYRFIWQEKVFSVGVSIGIATIGRTVRSLQEVLAAGDAACYRAKEQGRNQVHFQAEAPVAEDLPTIHPWHERIINALADNRIAWDAQPLRRLQASDQPEHFAEISLRIADRLNPPIPASGLKEAAERHELAETLDLRLLETAIAALARAHLFARRMRCLIPLSAPTIRQGQVVDWLARALQEHQLRPTSFYLLVSEEAALRHTAQVIGLCRAAKRLGCRIVLDEFGGGFGSFGQLHTIRPDCVRINPSLTRDLDTDRGAAVLVRAIQEITHDMGIETIATGVDDLAACRRLEALGITYGQGRAIAPSEPFGDWVEGAVIRGR